MESKKRKRKRQRHQVAWKDRKIRA